MKELPNMDSTQTSWLCVVLAEVLILLSEQPFSSLEKNARSSKLYSCFAPWSAITSWKSQNILLRSGRRKIGLYRLTHSTCLPQTKRHKRMIHSCTLLKLLSKKRAKCQVLSCKLQNLIIYAEKLIWSFQYSKRLESISTTWTTLVNLMDSM